MPIELREERRTASPIRGQRPAGGQVRRRGSEGKSRLNGLRGRAGGGKVWAANLGSACSPHVVKVVVKARGATGRHTLPSPKPPIRMRLVVLSLTVALSVGSAYAVESEVEKSIARFELFNSCLPMGIVVESLPTEAARIGLTTQSLRTALESRLRAARLYDEIPYSYLYLNVNLVGAAFNISLEYNRRICHSGDLCGHATTWSVSSVGTHGKGNAGFIRTAISEHMDSFLVEYLKVNEAACSGN